MQFWTGNILNDNIGSRIDKFVGFAPIMYLGNMYSNTIYLQLLTRYEYILPLFSDTMMYYGKYHDFVVPFFIEVAHYFPRTLWAYLENGFGISYWANIDYSQLPVMARNDIGGTSVTNTMHYV